MRIVRLAVMVTTQVGLIYVADDDNDGHFDDDNDGEDDDETMTRCGHMALTNSYLHMAY